MCLALVSTAPTDFKEELAFLNSLKADLMYNTYDGAMTVQDIPEVSTVSVHPKNKYQYTVNLEILHFLPSVFSSHSTFPLRAVATQNRVG